MLNLIRIGIAKATAPGVVLSPKYESNWELEDSRDLKELYRKIMGHLESGDYGTYLAVREIFGEDVANAASLNGQFKGLNLRGGTSKR